MSGAVASALRQYLSHPIETALGRDRDGDVRHQSKACESVAKRERINGLRQGNLDVDSASALSPDRHCSSSTANSTEKAAGICSIAGARYIARKLLDNAEGTLGEVTCCIYPFNLLTKLFDPTNAIVVRRCGDWQATNLFE